LGPKVRAFDVDDSMLKDRRSVDDVAERGSDAQDAQVKSGVTGDQVCPPR
jgi:hypothetical protein